MKKWGRYLHIALLACRPSPISRLKRSLFEVLYGRRAELPISNQKPLQTQQNEDLKGSLDSLRKGSQQLSKENRDNEIQKVKVRDVRDLVPGETVYWKINPMERTYKMDFKFDEPS